MPDRNNQRIDEADDKALVQIVLDYLHGDELEEIKHKLKTQCTKYGIACKVRFQGIRATRDKNEDYANCITDMLNELSVGGSELHFLPIDRAKRALSINCYVWDEENNQLYYINANGVSEILNTTNHALFIDMVNRLKPANGDITRHLFYKQIKELITTNTANRHVPATTDIEAIQDYQRSQNLYALLKKLKNKHRHLAHLVDLIDDTKPERNWGLYFTLAAFVTAVSGVLFYLKENINSLKAWFDRILPLISQWLNNAINLLRSTPLVGILIHAIPLIQSWYRAITATSRADANKIAKLFFNTLEHTLPIAGYILCYLAAGTMTLPALSLFVIGSAIDVIETLYSVIVDASERHKNPLAPATEYYSATARARADNLYERDRYLFIINFVANIFSTATVLVWCAFPPSLMIALPCVVFGWLVGLAKQSLTSFVKDDFANTLQRELHTIHAQQYPEPNQTDTAQVNIERSTVALLTEENRALRQELAQQKAYFDGYKEGQRDSRSHFRAMGFFDQNKATIVQNRYQPINTDYDDENASDNEQEPLIRTINKNG